MGRIALIRCPHRRTCDVVPRPSLVDFCLRIVGNGALPQPHSTCEAKAFIRLDHVQAGISVLQAEASNGVQSGAQMTAYPPPPRTLMPARLTWVLLGTSNACLWQQVVKGTAVRSASLLYIPTLDSTIASLCSIDPTILSNSSQAGRWARGGGHVCWGDG